MNPAHLTPELGAHLHEQNGQSGVQFAVWAPQAEGLEVCLFDSATGPETQRIVLANVGNGIWQATFASGDPLRGEPGAGNFGVLRSGALPVDLKVVEERSVGPDLGTESIQAGLLAGAVGTIAVLTFMIVTYGRFGVYANIALILNILLILGLSAWMRPLPTGSTCLNARRWASCG